MPAAPSQPDPSRRRPAGELVAQGGVDGAEPQDLESAAADQQDASRHPLPTCRRSADRRDAAAVAHEAQEVGMPRLNRGDGAGHPAGADRRRPAGEMVAQGNIDGAELQDLERVARPIDRAMLAALPPLTMACKVREHRALAHSAAAAAGPAVARRRPFATRRSVWQKARSESAVMHF